MKKLVHKNQIIPITALCGDDRGGRIFEFYGTGDCDR